MKPLTLIRALAMAWLIGSLGAPALADDAINPVTPGKLVTRIFPGASGGPKGPDGKYHDAFEPSDFSVRTGQAVHLEIVNHDMMAHSMIQPDLGLDITARAATMGKDGKMTPGVTMATFSVPVRGSYRWFCTEPCDTDAGGWAMSPGAHGKDAGLPDRDAFMAGVITAY